MGNWLRRRRLLLRNANLSVDLDFNARVYDTCTQYNACAEHDPIGDGEHRQLFRQRGIHSQPGASDFGQRRLDEQYVRQPCAGDE